MSSTGMLLGARASAAGAGFVGQYHRRTPGLHVAFLRFRNNAIARSRATERAPRCFVGWQTSFDFGDGQVKRNKRIDTRLSWPLFMVDFLTFAGVDPASRGQ